MSPEDLAQLEALGVVVHFASIPVPEPEPVILAINGVHVLQFETDKSKPYVIRTQGKETASFVYYAVAEQALFWGLLENSVALIHS